MALLMLIEFDMNVKMPNKRTRGMTLLETLVVMVLLAILVAMLAPAFSRPSQSSRIACRHNLKQIGAAFQSWAEDNLNAYPMELSTNEGGTQEYAFGPEVFRHFQAMQNELGQSPKVVLCPADMERFPAINFNDFNNSNLSYFVGTTVSATNENMDLFLCGDRNITNGSIPRPNPMELTTNDLAGWIIDNHGGAQSPAGNILFSDYSVNWLSTPALRQALQKPGVAPAVVAVP
jgi:prepilin-type N-terminal cleavage/methylation domain-containing protein